MRGKQTTNLDYGIYLTLFGIKGKLQQQAFTMKKKNA